MTAASDGENQVVAARERDRVGHVVRSRALRDQRRPLVDHGVVNLAGPVVVDVIGPDQASAEAGELLASGARCCRDGAHAVLLRWTISDVLRQP